MLGQQINEFNIDTFEVDEKVENVKKQMSHFLGLLQKSIDSQSLYSNQTPKHSQTQRKLSTIISASQQNEQNSEGQEARKQQFHKSKSQDYEPHELYYDESIQTKAFEPITQIIKVPPLEIPHPPTNSSTRISQASTRKSQPVAVIQNVSPHLDSEKTGRSTESSIMYDQKMLLKEIQPLVNEKNIPLLAQKIKGIVRDYKNYIDVLQQRNREILIKCEKYRVKSEHLYKALETLKQQQSKIIEAFASNKNEQTEILQKEIEKKNEKLVKENEIYRSQNSYLKELIILANKNYENLQKKLQDTQSQNQKYEAMIKQRQKQFMQGNSVLKEVILSLGKQNKVVPKQDKQQCNLTKLLEKTTPNVKTNSTNNTKQEIEETYRKMFIKNMKSKRP